MADWNPCDPFVTDADGFVVGLSCMPSHHADLLAAGWEGGGNLFPLVADSPEAFTADVLTYARDVPAGRQTCTATLADEPPYVYVVSEPLLVTSP